MKQVNISIEAEAKKLVVAMKKFLRDEGSSCNMGEFSISYDNYELPLQAVISVDNDGKLGADLSSVVIKSPRLRLISVTEYKDDYMWDIDIYIRPSTVIVVSL